MDPQLAQVVRAALEPVPEVLDAWVFGSQARGDAHAGSDVDVAVTVARGPVDKERWPWGLRAGIASALMAALSRGDVDVVLLHEAPPLLARRVMRDGVLVFTRDEAATTCRVAERLVRWWDWKPVQDWIDRARMERA